MKNIAVGIDFSDRGMAVLDRAADLALALDAHLFLVHIYAPEPDFVGYAEFAYPGKDERAQELREEKAKIRELIDALKKRGVEATGYMREGDTVHALLEFTQQREASMLVIGSHGKGFVERLLLGSVAEGIIRHATLPVVVVPSAKQG
ncbi:MAG: universal stress protein [Verrucomicrobiales bacterium]|nr:universal stress protein [Verrucomicrobiales bacterium]